MEFIFFMNSALLGLGLAMDAFSVSLANGLNERQMPARKMLCIAGMFAFFQALMPMLGWVCVNTVVSHFKAFEAFIPWIALVLLLFIGGKMIVDAIRKKEEAEPIKLGWCALLGQGVATSIDALSVGFTIAGYNLIEALVSAAVIAAVTFAMCFVGVFLGKKFGTVFSNKATLIGGIILVVIGIEIFITGII